MRSNQPLHRMRLRRIGEVAVKPKTSNAQPAIMSQRCRFSGSRSRKCSVGGFAWALGVWTPPLEDKPLWDSLHRLRRILDIGSKWTVGSVSFSQACSCLFHAVGLDVCGYRSWYASLAADCVSESRARVLRADR